MRQLAAGEAGKYVLEQGVHYTDTIDWANDNFADYDSALFGYNNGLAGAPDPSILKVEDPESELYGQYLLFGTTGANAGFQCYYSDDLVNWRDRYQVFRPNPNSWSEANTSVSRDYWAPECIWDKDTGLYYLFFSARNTRLLSHRGTARTLSVAVSENPDGPYYEYAEYLLRKECAKEGREPTSSEIASALYLPWFSSEEMLKAEQKRFPDAITDEMTKTWGFSGIDPHPYVDPISGNKYLYLVADFNQATGTHSWIYVMEMIDWVTPKYETLTQLTSHDGMGYEKTDNTINEGPQMLYNANNGKYYLQFSTGSYGDSSYNVGIAIGDTPMGPFTKLSKEEGGLFISSLGSTIVSGPGHHYIINVGDRMFAVYHRHRDPIVGGGSRVACIDEVVWVKNNDGLDVLHLNGCSTTLTFAPISEYKNIAPEAKITASAGENVAMLTDNVIATQTYETWIKEYQFSSDSTRIKFDFDDYRSIAGIMIFNSLYYDTSFEIIQEIELECMTESGRKYRAYIKDLMFNPEFLVDNKVVPASAAIAAFNDVLVKSVTIKVERLYQNQETIAIGEIYILGK